MRWEVIVRFADIGGIINHQCGNSYEQKSYYENYIFQLYYKVYMWWSGIVISMGLFYHTMKVIALSVLFELLNYLFIISLLFALNIPFNYNLEQIAVQKKPSPLQLHTLIQ